MKVKAKIIIIITLGILFAFSSTISKNLKLNSGISDNSTDYSDDINFDNETVKLSAISGKIHIDNNWTAAKAVGICTGNGTYSEPYVVKDLVIDGGGSGSCILIENSNVFFKIENCTVYNSGSMGEDAGIKLYNINNSKLINNNFLSNYIGIRLGYSHNNTISGNTATYSIESGIFLYFSDNNYIANNSWCGGQYGISLFFCKNITVSKNKMNDSGLDIYGYLPLDNINADTTNLVNGKPVYFYYNQINLGSDNFTNAGQVILYDCHNSLIENLNTSYGSTGISLYYCSNNNITGNTANHNKNDGIDLSESDNNNIWDNNLDYNDGYGIDLYRSYNNIISKNNASYNLEGICSWICNRNNISGNIFNANRLSGLYLYDSRYNNISGNTANNNIHYGILLLSSDYNIISRNIFNTNRLSGLYLYDSSYNNISGNTANNNIRYGIHLLSSDYNIISRNTLLVNTECIVEMDCEGNIFENNDCGKGIPFELIIVISIISGGAVIGVATLLLIRRKRKRIE